MEPKITAFEVGNFPVEVVTDGKKRVAKRGEYIVFGFACGAIVVSKEVFEKQYKQFVKKD